MLEVQQSYTIHSLAAQDVSAPQQRVTKGRCGAFGVATPGSCACNAARGAPGGKETYHGKPALAVTLCLYTELQVEALCTVKWAKSNFQTGERCPCHLERKLR